MGVAMSKHKHKNRNIYNRMNRNQSGPNNYGPINNNPFGINPQQLLSILGGNFNMNGLGNILSSMNMDGFDLNSMSNLMGMNSDFSPNNGFNNRNENNDLKDKDNKPNNESITIDKEIDEGEEKIEQIRFENLDENKKNNEDIQLLIALRDIVDPKRVEFLNKIIDMYDKGLL